MVDARERGGDQRGDRLAERGTDERDDVGRPEPGRPGAVQSATASRPAAVVDASRPTVQPTAPRPTVAWTGSGAARRAGRPP